MSHTTAALVGVTGGAGTTRTVVELATTLAAADRDVAVIDAAYATQGLGDYLSGRLDPDVTALVTDQTETPLESGLVEFEVGVDGRVACLPAHAPFERLARAKSADAAQAFEARIEEAATGFEHVLVDVPPVASNQAISAATATERVGLVAPADQRGYDAVQRLHERLADLGTEPDTVVAIRGPVDGCDVTLPETSADVPACLSDDAYGSAVATAAKLLLDVEVESPAKKDGLFGGVSNYVSR